MWAIGRTPTWRMPFWHLAQTLSRLLIHRHTLWRVPGKHLWERRFGYLYPP